MSRRLGKRALLSRERARRVVADVIEAALSSGEAWTYETAEGGVDLSLPDSLSELARLIRQGADIMKDTREKQDASGDLDP